MDQIKIGKFIASCRKNKNLTQTQLAEMLNISDRAVSKWERGKSMPDSSIMLELCNILEITVNDLLCGEIVSTDDYTEKTEENLIELKKSNEKFSRQFLNLEIAIGVIGTCSFLTLWLVASFSELHSVVKFIMMFVAVMLLIITVVSALKIEQTAGYYECGNCRHRYVPSFNSVAFAVHSGRSRCLMCPKCKKLSWHKKVISKDE